MLLQECMFSSILATPGVSFAAALRGRTDSALSRPGVLSIYPRGGPNRKHRLQQSLYYCYGRLPSNNSDIVDVFTGRYQATYILFRGRCIAPVLHVTLHLVSALDTCSSFPKGVGRQIYYEK
jgi:hypothetical protein